ncbi:MAG: 5-(carboxyamino)imidazole ribonucleotide synthase, partial [Rickettsiales bacterium]|nr:5-(carboxyamino)imidazole ribonucleotide synthase [Rickettsiales bacterium]
MKNITTNIVPPGSVIGIIGGGQLGRMTALSASNLGYRVHIYTPEQQSEPATQVADAVTIGNYGDIDKLHQFAKNVDVVTLEFENIPHASVQYMQEELKIEICPGWEALYHTQNRFREKCFINQLDIKTAPYELIKTKEDLNTSINTLGRPSILKTNEMGYDGKGQYVIKEDTESDDIWNQLQQHTNPHGWLLEGFVPFEREISTIIARGKDGQSQCFIPTENIHKNGILKKSIAPAHIEPSLIDLAYEYTAKIASALNYIGVMAVEYFVVDSNTLLANEIAPRPHNSGHWTMDACMTSQFEQHVRAVCGLPLGNTDMLCHVEMLNLIGDDINSWPEYLSENNS